MSSLRRLSLRACTGLVLLALAGAGASHEPACAFSVQVPPEMQQLNAETPTVAPPAPHEAEATASPTAAATPRAGAGTEANAPSPEAASPLPDASAAPGTAPATPSASPSSPAPAEGKGRSYGLYGVLLLVAGGGALYLKKRADED